MRLTPADRVAAVAAAAAHDLNDDLTVILSTAQLALRQAPAGCPTRPLLLELQAAALRCAWKSSGLLNFASRRNVRPSAATMEALADVA